MNDPFAVRWQFLPGGSTRSVYSVDGDWIATAKTAAYAVRLIDQHNKTLPPPAAVDGGFSGPNGGFGA